MLKNLCPTLVPGGAELSLEQAVNLARDSGYDSIELPIEEVVRLVEEKSLGYISDLLAEAGLLPGGWQVLFEKGDAWRADEDTYQRSLAALARYAEVAQRLGCTRAFTWVPSYSDERDFDANFVWHVERLRPIARILGDHGCTFGLEWQGPRTLWAGHRYRFIHTQQGMKELIDAISEPNVGFLLDTWHWYTSRGTLEDIRSLTASQVVYVHVNDAPEGVPFEDHLDLVREVPGRTGIIDLVGFLKALKAIGYDGPVEPSVVGCPYLDSMSTLEAARTNCEALTRLLQAAEIPCSVPCQNRKGSTDTTPGLSPQSPIECVSMIG